MHDLVRLFGDLLIFVAAMTALLIGLLVALARLPAGNPLKRLMVAACYRIGAMAAAGVIAIPVAPVPGLDALYDIAAPIGLAWFWVGFFRDIAMVLRKPR